MTDKIDWTKPIEAYHEDGRVEKAEVINPLTVMIFCSSIPNDGKWFFSDDGGTVFQGWRIRNRKSYKPLCVDTLRKVLEVLPEPNLATADRWEVQALSDCRLVVEALFPKARAETLVEEWAKWAGYPYPPPVSAKENAKSLLYWLDANGHLVKGER